MNAFKLLAASAVCGLAIFMSSCKPKPNPTPVVPSFTLKMNARFGEQSFTLHAANTDASGKYIVINNLMFYLSDINLIKNDGSKVNVAKAAIFDFSDSTTLSVKVNNVSGTFTGISFGCGLDSVQNLSNPNDSVFPNPYSGDWNMYWDMLTAYRFEVMDGKWDTAVNISGGMRNALDYHVGTNPSYRQTQLNKNFSVCCGTNTPLNLYLDVAQLFNNTTTGETLNITVLTQEFTNSATTDPPGCLVTMKTFADNFSNSFTF